MNEAETRKRLIDRQLEAAGWRLNDRTQVGREVHVTRIVRDKGDTAYGSDVSEGIADDCLYDEDGCILSVVESKRTARSPREGEEQLRLYIEGIARCRSFVPFGFMANGRTTWFWEVWRIPAWWPGSSPVPTSNAFASSGRTGYRWPQRPSVGPS
jgi:type I restriction enzyme, R subunit